MKRGTKRLTKVFEELKKGSPAAYENLWPQVYDEIHKIACHYLKGHRRSETMRPTALVNEAYLKILNSENFKFESKTHFFAVAATAMRQIMIDHARKKNKLKRGGGEIRLSFDEKLHSEKTDDSLQVLAINEALERLLKKDELLAKLVELKFFGGLEINEIAEHLKLSPSTVKRKWNDAKEMLLTDLQAKTDVLKNSPGKTARLYVEKRMKNESKKTETAMKAEISEYRLIRKINTGGMAEIFEAKKVGAPKDQKAVALKKPLDFLKGKKEVEQMFKEEAKLYSMLDHPNIVKMLEFVATKEGDYCLAMEFVPGKNAGQVVQISRSKDQPIGVPAALFIAVETLKALEYAHSRKVIHRDISPENIVLSTDGHVKLIDFGIAKNMSSELKTITGIRKGKYAFMSPEQALGNKLDTRTDIYSMGLVLYELLTLNPAIEGANDFAVFRSAQAGFTRDLTRDKKDIPGPLQLILKKAMERDPKDRFQTAGEFRSALEWFAKESKVGIASTLISLRSA